MSSRYVRGPLIERFNAKYIPEPTSGCWIWTAYVNACGYGIIGVRKRVNILAHRASWMLFRGEIPEGQNVLHRCDIPCCVNPDHLFLGTQVDNILDMMVKRRDRHPWGESSGQAKLTEAQVREIRQMAGSQKKLASLFGVSAGLIGHIRRRVAWAHLGEEC